MLNKHNPDCNYERGTEPWLKYFVPTGFVILVNFNFFLFLALYLLFAIAALTSGEIRRATGQATATARSGLKRFYPRLALHSVLVTLGILSLTAGLFFLLPRTAEAAFSR